MNLKSQSELFGLQVVANMFNQPEGQEAGGWCNPTYLCCLFACGYDGVTFGCFDFTCDYRYTCHEEHSCGSGFVCVRTYYYQGSC